jgi:hypothetical protein
MKDFDHFVIGRGISHTIVWAIKYPWTRLRSLSLIMRMNQNLILIVVQLKKDQRPYPIHPYINILLDDFVLCHSNDRHYLPIWMGRVWSFVDLTEGINYKNMSIEWWTPLCAKKEGKRAIARECWTRRWTKEATLPNVICHITILFSHMMSCHANLRPPTTHLIPKAFVNVTMANLMFAGFVVDPKEDCKD